MKYINCKNGETFEDFVDSLVDSEDVFQYEYGEECEPIKSQCRLCYRNESMRYCGQDYPQLGIYKGDHYDDVIESIVANFYSN